MRFFVNLRPELVGVFRRAWTPPGFLLSTHRLDGTTGREARLVRGRGVELFADNGTKPQLEAIFGAAGRGRWTAERVVREAATRLAAVDAGAVLDAQLSMRPTRLVAVEDFTAGALVGLGMLDQVGTAVALAGARRTIEQWTLASSDPRCRDLEVYATLGAWSYATARAVARAAASAGADRVTIGFAGANRDRVWTDDARLGRRIVKLPGRAPRRYVQAVEVLTGVRDGYRDAGVPLRALHALGMGAPALFAVVAAVFDDATEITADATSPIYDTFCDRVLYEPGTGRRLHLVQVARSLAGGGAWDCGCVFCRRSQRAWRLDALARGLAGRRAEKADLLPEGAVGAAVPLLASTTGPADRPFTLTRLGHNHVVLADVAAAMPATDRRRWGRERLDALAGDRRWEVAVRTGTAAAAAVLDRAG